MTTKTTPKLTKAQAVKLHDAEVRVRRAKALLEEAEAAREVLRARYRPRIPLSSDPDEAAKGIRVASVGGITIRVAPAVSPERFSLAAYRDAGHGITPEMREHIAPGRPYDRWTVRGPAKRANAVEPS